MAFVIDLPPAQEKRLQTIAEQQGVLVSELITRAVKEKFFAADDNAASLALIQQWLSEAPATPEAIAEAQEDLRELKEALNESRRTAGARLLFPEEK